jgi:Tfp pilus assembly protein PilE
MNWFYKRKRTGGWTLAELMIVIAIIIVLLILVLIGFGFQIKRSHDAQRKTDLAKIRRAFEEYYNDHDCYPPATILDSCGGSSLSPYLAAVPCDPVKKTPYKYVPVSGNECSGFVACAALEDLNDPDIARIGCHPTEGCGWGMGFNYCLSMGTAAALPGAQLGGNGPTPTPTISPTPTPLPGNYACTPSGACNQYANPVQFGCPFTYQLQGCNYQGVFQCQFIENRCTQ